MLIQDRAKRREKKKPWGKNNAATDYSTRLISQTTNDLLSGSFIKGSAPGSSIRVQSISGIFP